MFPALTSSFSCDLTSSTASLVFHIFDIIGIFDIFGTFDIFGVLSILDILHIFGTLDTLGTLGILSSLGGLCAISGFWFRVSFSLVKTFLLIILSCEFMTGSASVYSPWLSVLVNSTG